MKRQSHLLVRLQPPLQGAILRNLGLCSQGRQAPCYQLLKRKVLMNECNRHPGVEEKQLRVTLAFFLRCRIGNDGL